MASKLHTILGFYRHPTLIRNLVFGTNKNPWPTATLTIISILFTPIVGGILAAENQKRFGFPERALKDYKLAAWAFLITVIYLTVLKFGAANMVDDLRWTLIIPSLALVHSIFIWPSSFIVFVILPFSWMIWDIRTRQEQSRRESAQAETHQWWKLYSSALTVSVLAGLLLMAIVTTLNGSAPWYLFSKPLDLLIGFLFSVF